MSKNTLFVGLDVHIDLIYIAIAETGRNGELRSLGSFANRPETIRKKFNKLKKDYKKISVCYEAGPCGYGLYWQLIGMDIDCDVIAPSLIPQRAGNRVKTDRKDALMLARCHRSGDLVPVWVPDAAHESLRDLVRAREGMKKDQRSARHRLSKLLMKRGIHKPQNLGNNWTVRHMTWLSTLKIDDPNVNYVFQDYLSEINHVTNRIKLVEAQLELAIENSPDEMKEIVGALQLMRGVSKITAFGLVAEIGYFSRFPKPDKLMAYSGLVPSEYTTGGPDKRRQGGITKTGNSHLRRLLTEAAWSYRFNPSENPRMVKSQAALPPGLVASVRETAWQAQHRLCGRYKSLLSIGKSKNLIISAVAREMLGFIWSIAVQIEGMHTAK
jgi:transposase